MSPYVKLWLTSKYVKFYHTVDLKDGCCFKAIFLSNILLQ